MKTLHQQQDSHHHADVRNKNILTSTKGEKNVEQPKTSMISLFAPFHHFGMGNHSLIPFFKLEKTASGNEDHTGSKNNEITKTIIEAYTKQIKLSLDTTQKLHKEFTEQITNLYNLNRQFWNTFLFRRVN